MKERVSLAHNKTPQDYVKTGKRRGRKTNAGKIAETNTTLNQFYRRSDAS